MTRGQQKRRPAKAALVTFENFHELPIEKTKNALFDGRNEAIANGGIDTIDQLAMRSCLIDEINTRIDLLKRHLPYHESDYIPLMDVKNTVRSNIWQKKSEAFRREATINVEGTIIATFGECKQGMDISHDGQWGYHPLIISLHNTREPTLAVSWRLKMQGDFYTISK